MTRFRVLRRAAFLAAGVSSWCCAAVFVHAQSADTLKTQVEQIIALHHGRVGLYAQQLNTGKTLAIDADMPVQTASTIKLAMLWTMLRQVASGKAAWDEKITLKPGEGVSGSGILHFLDTPVTLTLKDVATMMVIVSDNTATNLMIDRFSTKQVNDDMTALGLDQTWLYKKVSKPASGPMPADQAKFGLGKTTPRQIASVMERIGRCDLNFPGQPRVGDAAQPVLPRDDSALPGVA